MAKRQIWFTDEEADLAIRLIDFALREIDKENLCGRTAWFAMQWTKASLNRLRAKFVGKDSP